MKERITFMKTTMIYCTPTQQGVHSFYLITEGQKYYLFSQNYRKGVREYFSKGVSLKESMDFAKTRNDNVIMRTMTKLSMYIRYIEKKNEIAVHEKKRNKSFERYHKKCA